MTWSGVFPAVTTKMLASGAIDLEATQASIDRLITEWRFGSDRPADAGRKCHADAIGT